MKNKMMNCAKMELRPRMVQMANVKQAMKNKMMHCAKMELRLRKVQMANVKQAISSKLNQLLLQVLLKRGKPAFLPPTKQDVERV